VLLLLNKRKFLCDVRTAVARDLDPVLDAIAKKNVRVSRILAFHLLLVAVHWLGNIVVTALLVSLRRNVSQGVTASGAVLVSVVHRVTTVILLLTARNPNALGLSPFGTPLLRRLLQTKVSRIIGIRHMKTKTF
jgi:hypothetical protein